MGRAEGMAPSMESVKDVFITVITPVASFLDPHRTSLVDRCAGKTYMHHILVMKHWSTVCKHYQLSRWRGGEALIIMLDDMKKASCWHQTTWKPLVCQHWILTANLVSCFTLNVRWKQLFNSKKNTMAVLTGTVQTATSLWAGVFFMLVHIDTIDCI